MASHQVYYNGKWVPDKGHGIPLTDLGFVLGTTVTERLRTFRGKVWRQAEHHRRLRRSVELIGLDPAIADELDVAVSQFAKKHEPLRLSGDDWTIVALATPGDGHHPTLCVHGYPLPFQDWAHYFEEGVRLQVTSVQQTPVECWPSELKCRSRMHYYLADKQAKEIEPGARALLLDRANNVCEASTANIVIYDGESIISPPKHRMLPGVSLGVLGNLAESRGIAYREEDLTVDQVINAKEVWLTGTSICIQPVVSCNGKPIGDGKPGAVYHRFLAAWNDLVGLDIAAQATNRAAALAHADH